MKVGVRFCGFCNPHFDVSVLLNKLGALTPGVEYIRWDDMNVEAYLYLSGCSRACAVRAGVREPKVVVAGTMVDYKFVPLRELPERIRKVLMLVDKEAARLSGEVNFKKRTDKRMTLEEAIKTFVQDGCSITFSGMGGAQCVAHTYEIIRQGKKDLVLIGDSPCEAGDMLVGAGCIRRMEIAWCSYAVAGLGNNFRRAVEQGVPHPIELEEYSNYTIGLRLLAGALNVPFLPTCSLSSSDIPKYNKNIRTVCDPYSSEEITVVPAARPDVGIVHVGRADKLGNAQQFGFSSNAENIARAAKHVIVTCEELVSTDEIQEQPNLTIIPQYAVDAVVEVPFASHPWNFPYYYAYDIPFHMQQLEAFKTRDGFLKWLDEWCYEAGSWDGYLQKVGYDCLDALRRIERRFTKARY